MYRLRFLSIFSFIVGCSFCSLRAELPEPLLSRVILIDSSQPPTIEYICLQSRAFPPINLTGLKEENSLQDVVHISFEDNQSNLNNSYILSNVHYSKISSWILASHSPQVDFHPLRNEFFSEISDDLSEFLIIKQAEFSRQLAETSRLWEENNYSSQNNYLSLKSKEKKNAKTATNSSSSGEFGKFALYLFVGGGVCAIYSVLAPTGSSGAQGGPGKIVKARRKRWLKKIYQLGWIDQKRYQFLLKRLDNLPQWLGGIISKAQSSDMEDSRVDLSSRKSGESVVRTKDKSSDNTSL